MTFEIPIVIVTRDRLECLKKCIKALDQLKTPTKIFISDNNTTWVPTLEYLSQLKSCGIPVYRHDSNNSVINTAKIVKIALKDTQSDFYVVTDPDIELCAVRGDMLEFYSYILNNVEKANVVGPMIRIDDLPDHYPLKDKVIKGHTRQFWRNPVKYMEFKGEKFKYIYAPIDCSFGMYRESFADWRKMNDGIRTFAPYSARHLDWYLDAENLSEDQVHYMNNIEVTKWSKDRFNAHWSGTYLRKYFNGKTV